MCGSQYCSPKRPLSFHSIEEWIHEPFRVSACLESTAMDAADTCRSHYHNSLESHPTATISHVVVSLNFSILFSFSHLLPLISALAPAFQPDSDSANSSTPPTSLAAPCPPSQYTSFPDSLPQTHRLQTQNFLLPVSSRRFFSSSGVRPVYRPWPVTRDRRLARLEIRD